jgi:hypothetical protein
MARRTRGLNTKPQAIAQAQAQKGQKNKRAKRVVAKKGDIVMLGSRTWTHNFGMVAKVIQVLDKNRLLCEGMPNDDDYLGVQLVVFTREPKDYPAKDYLPWVKRVISVRERVVIKEVEVRPKRVVSTHEELADVLADGDDSEHVVVQLPPAKSATVAHHPSAKKP